MNSEDQATINLADSMTPETPRWLFMDGGRKYVEWVLWKRLLRPGELIFTHDYSNTDYNEYWLWTEVHKNQLDLIRRV
jgi:hypothetical protein